MIRILFDEKEVHLVGPNPGDDEFSNYRAAKLQVFVYCVKDSGPPVWFDRLEFHAKNVVAGEYTDLTKEAEEHLLLKRDPALTMDVRVCFSDDYGTWAQIVGAKSDADAIRRTIDKLDKTWAICEPLLKDFLEQYKPEMAEEGTPG